MMQMEEDKMVNPIVDQTWTGVLKVPSKSKQHPSSDPLQKLVDETLRGLRDDLLPYLTTTVKSFEAQLTLVKRDRSVRLSRGINEEGMISRDFGKSFTGYYFESLKLQLKTPKGTKKKLIAFLHLYVEGLVIQYFINHPSEVSNWENSYRNQNGSRISSTASPSTMINFPAIEIHLT